LRLDQHELGHSVTTTVDHNTRIVYYNANQFVDSDKFLTQCSGNIDIFKKANK